MSQKEEAEYQRNQAEMEERCAAEEAAKEANAAKERAAKKRPATPET